MSAARSIGDDAARRDLLRRVDSLRPDSPPQWGTLDAPRMLAHLGDSIAVALGEMPGGARMGPSVFRHFPLKHLILYAVPFPKGAKSPKEFMATVPEDFASAKQRLQDLMQRAAAVPAGSGPEHPLLGPLRNDEWRALGWKHIDHHLRQFGC